MPDTNPAPEFLLPLHCPKCDHDKAALFVNSYTVLTVQCVECSHTWSAEISALPEQVRKDLSPLGPRLVRSNSDARGEV